MRIIIKLKIIKKFENVFLKKKIIKVFEKILLKCLFKKYKLIKNQPIVKKKYIIAILVALSGLLKIKKSGIDIINKKKFINAGILIKNELTWKVYKIIPIITKYVCMTKILKITILSISKKLLILKSSIITSINKKMLDIMKIKIRFNDLKLI